MRYRIALDLGSTSLGWAMVRLDAQNETCAVIKAGVRIFSDGRNPKDGSSLAVSRREARAMRRRRDRLVKRKNRMLQTLLRFDELPKYLDATDGLAAAVCHHFSKGIGEHNKAGGNSWGSFVKNNPQRTV